MNTVIADILILKTISEMIYESSLIITGYIIDTNLYNCPNGDVRSITHVKIVDLVKGTVNSSVIEINTFRGTRNRLSDLSAVFNVGDEVLLFLRGQSTYEIEGSIQGKYNIVNGFIDGTNNNKQEFIQEIKNVLNDKTREFKLEIPDVIYLSNTQSQEQVKKAAHYGHDNGYHFGRHFRTSANTYTSGNYPNYPNNQYKITYHINPDSCFDKNGSYVGFNAIRNTLQKVCDTWNSVPHANIYFCIDPDSTTLRRDKYDDISVISFQYISPSWSAYSDYDQTNDADESRESDITFNTGLNNSIRWSVGDTYDGGNNVFDFQHIATHEMGHSLGLMHPAPINETTQEQIITDYTMEQYGFQGFGDIWMRSLEPFDKTGAVHESTWPGGTTDGFDQAWSTKQITQGDTLYIQSNVTIDTGDTIWVDPGVYIDLQNYFIETNGGCFIDDGAVWEPYITVTSGSSLKGVYSDLSTAVNSSTYEDSIFVGCDIILTSNITIPSGIILILDESIDIDLQNHYLRTTDGTIIDEGANWIPYFIRKTTAGGAFVAAYPTFDSALSSSLYGETIYVKSTFNLNFDLAIPEGTTINIASSVPVNLQGHYIRTNYGTIIDNGANWNPSYIRKTTIGSSFRGAYPTFDSAFYSSLYGETVYVKDNFNLNFDVVIPEGTTVNVASGVTVNLQNHYIRTNGGSLTDNGVNWTPFYVLRTLGTFNGAYPTFAFAYGISDTGETLYIKSNFTLSSNITIPSGIVVYIYPSVTVTLAGYYMRTTGSGALIDNGVNWSPYYVRKNGSMFDAAYSDFAPALYGASTGDSVIVKSDYTLNTNFSILSGITVKIYPSININLQDYYIRTSGGVLLENGVNWSPYYVRSNGGACKGAYPAFNTAVYSSTSGDIITVKNNFQIPYGTGVGISQGITVRLHSDADVAVFGTLVLGEGVCITKIPEQTECGAITIENSGLLNIVGNCCFQYGYPNLWIKNSNGFNNGDEFLVEFENSTVAIYIDNCGPSINNAAIWGAYTDIGISVAGGSAAPDLYHVSIGSESAYEIENGLRVWASSDVILDHSNIWDVSNVRLYVDSTAAAVIDDSYNNISFGSAANEEWGIYCTGVTYPVDVRGVYFSSDPYLEPEEVVSDLDGIIIENWNYRAISWRNNGAPKIATPVNENPLHSAIELERMGEIENAVMEFKNIIATTDYPPYRRIAIKSIITIDERNDFSFDEIRDIIAEELRSIEKLNSSTKEYKWMKPSLDYLMTELDVREALRLDSPERDQLLRNAAARFEQLSANYSGESMEVEMLSRIANIYGDMLNDPETAKQYADRAAQIEPENESLRSAYHSANIKYDPRDFEDKKEIAAEQTIPDIPLIPEPEPEPEILETLSDYVTVSPNPANPVSHITYSIAEPSHAKLDIYSINGQKIETLVDEYCDAGTYTAVFNGAGKASGVYFYQFQSKSFSTTGKLLLMK